ncbi:MAG: AtpZ/AtpI family protein [Dehalococcoidia bacterium]|nr:AtpZ/AtpI family protein [Dehalococcoidia bacterium]MDD5495133.1 AtpZ/AtpI family protein [Dehalococcoidia bacterium]
MPLLKQDKEEKPEKRQILQGLWFLFNVGWYIALSIVLPTALGLWLDAPERWNSRPLCTLIGFIFGTILAIYGLYRMFKQFLAAQKTDGTEKNSNKEQDSE